MIEHGANPPSAVILATATVDPKGMPNVARIDPIVRMNDYKWALDRWLRVCDLPIVFCENSGADLAQLREIADLHPNRVEFLSFEAPDFPRHKGKGYGELLIFSHAFQHSRLISPETLIVKVTGRLFVENFPHVWDSIEKSGCDVCSGWFFDDLRWADPQFFAATQPFIRQYLIDRAEELDERDDSILYVEHLLAQGVLMHVLGGGRYKLLQGVDMRGVTGTGNTRLGPPDPPLPPPPASFARRWVRRFRHAYGALRG